MSSKEQNIFHEHLRRTRLKRTAQRDVILDVFLGTEGHVSNEDIYALVKDKDTSVGFTTVYRTMKLLKDCGLARELESFSGTILYEHDFKATHHDHLICTHCGNVIEFYSKDIEKVQDSIVKRHKFKPHFHSHRIFGVCSVCQEAEENPRHSKYRPASR